LFSYSYARHKTDERKNGPALRAIRMAMWIRWYNAERIAHDGRIRATLDASDAAIGKVFARIAPADVMVINFGSKNCVVVL
jgi:hypothetical protein